MHNLNLPDPGAARRKVPQPHSSSSQPTNVEELLTELRHAAEVAGHAFGPQDWASAAFGQVFADWLSTFTYTHVVAADPGAEYSLIWLIARHHGRLDAQPRSAPLVAIALNPETHRFLPVSGSGKGLTVTELTADPGKLIEFITRVAASGDHHRLRLGPSLKSIQAAITKLHARLMQAADDLLQLVAEGAHLRAPQHAALAPIARTLMQTHLKRRRTALNADITRTVKMKTVIWSQQLICQKHGTTPLVVYNHVLAAPTPEATKHRRHAIELLSASGTLRLDDAALWSKVDVGRPPQDIIAPLLGVRSSTMRIALKHWANVYSWAYIATLLPYLDALDPSQWPITDDDRYAFETAMRMATVFGRTFELEPKEVLRNWKKEARLTPWFELVETKLARHAEAQQRVFQEVRYNQMLNSTANMASSSARYATDIENVDHMRSDINRRFIFAALRLEADRLGANYAEAAYRIGGPLAARMWAEAKPSEQLLISARWHVAQRTWTDPPAPRTPEALSLDSWRTVIEAPLTLACGVTVHPLDTAAKLSEEGAAMQHCVATMSMQCRLGTTHLFSLRDAAGMRLSTLSVISHAADGDGNRRVTLRQNLAVRNAAPPARAVQAASEFMIRLNRSDLPSGVMPIEIDWAAIDASRRPLPRSDASDNREYGFAIHNPDARAAMTNLIWPYLPHGLKSRARDIAGTARVTFEDLSAAAGIPEAMASWTRLRQLSW